MKEYVHEPGWELRTSALGKATHHLSCHSPAGMTNVIGPKSVVTRIQSE